MIERRLRKIAETWPGKSPAEPGGVAHPAIFHMLDVAAVAECLLQDKGFTEPQRHALVLLAALHDLGKINEAFRAMLRHGQPQTAGLHWEVTEAFLRLHDDLLAPFFDGSSLYSRYELYAAAAGHHGRPPVRDLRLNRSSTGPGADWKAMLDAAGETAVADSAEVVRAFICLWPKASLGALKTSEARRVSWHLAGVVTAADWIGSNVDWFPAMAPGLKLPAYLAEARERAAEAVARAGIVTPTVSSEQIFDFAPRPMQTACAEVELQQGPMLAIIEDETGSGKTEAALILAQRMLRRGKGNGLYFALPTMATADAMFDRVREVLKRLYERAPSLGLAHNRAGLHTGFRELAVIRDRNPDEPGPTDWLVDNRRKALLANVGVGTIDQALLAVVRAKHAPLRQFGLSSTILVVDEAHEMGDPYMRELLASLLRLHADQGGSAIMLSATLPMKLRAELTEAFESGAQRPTLADENRAYPVLTVPGVAAPMLAPTREQPSRGPVTVMRLKENEEALDILDRGGGIGGSLRLGAKCRGRSYCCLPHFARARHPSRSPARAFCSLRPQEA